MAVPFRSTAGWPGAAIESRRRPAPSAAANFTLRLIQVHMCIIYFFAGISKLQGLAWWNGLAMWMALGNLEYQSADTSWLAWHPWAINFLTHMTALWELSFCVLIWIPLVATAGDCAVGALAHRDRGMPGVVDVFTHHARRLRVVLAGGWGWPFGGGFGHYCRRIAAFEGGKVKASGSSCSPL